MTPELLVSEVAKQLHSGYPDRAAEYFAAAKSLAKPETEQDVWTILNSLLKWCLERNRKDLATALLWTPAQFTAEPRSVRMIWEALQEWPFSIFMGASSMGKSYTPGVAFFLEWLADPQYTRFMAIGPSEDHLRGNLFSHLNELHARSAIPLPGRSQDLFIGLDSKNKRGGVQGVVIPQGGTSKGAGKIQGTKRVPRPQPHPIFGTMSRLFLLIDELENVPTGLFKDLDNVFSALQEAGDKGFKVAASYNPKDPTLRPYRMAEPEKGWDKLNPDTDEIWTSKQGWRVVRLDASKSENVTQNKVIFPGLQTAAGYKQLARASGGEDSPSFWTFGRGLYPPMGSDQTLFTQATLEQRMGEPLFIGATQNCAGVDLALEGGDRAWLVPGTFGTATGLRVHGRIIPFTNQEGEPITKPILVVRQPVTLPKAETVEMARNIRMEATSRQMDPRWMCLDRTGVGSGVHDLLRALWSPDIQGVNYSESASDQKVLLEEEGTAKELYARMVGELWFAARRLVEHSFVVFDPKAHWEDLWAQLCARKYHPGRNNRVETKTDFKARGNRSPDAADAFTLLVHAMRSASGVQFSVSKWSGYEAQQGSPANLLDEPDIHSDDDPDPAQVLDSLDD